MFADISIYKSYTTLESYGYSSRDTLISSFGSDNAEYIFLSSHFGSSVADRDIRRSLLTKSSSRKIFSEVIPESSVSWYESVLNVDQFYDTDSFTRSNILVVKPNISSGSKGVFILRPDEDWSLLKTKLENSIDLSMDNMLHIEPYVPNTGIKYYCEGIYAAGNLYMIVGESLMGGCEGLTPIGSRYLAYFSSDQVQSATPPMFSNLIKCLQKFFREVSIGDTFFNCDFFETSDHNIHLIELSPRPGGNFLPVVFGHVWGINVFDYYYNYLIDRISPLAMPQCRAKYIGNNEFL